MIILGYMLDSAFLFYFSVGYILSFITRFLYGDEVILLKNSIKLNLEYNLLTIIRIFIVGLFLMLLIYSLNIDESRKVAIYFLILLSIVFLSLNVNVINNLSYVFYVYFNNFALNFLGENFSNKLENREKYFFKNNKKIYAHNTHKILINNSTTNKNNNNPVNIDYIKDSSMKINDNLSGDNYSDNSLLDIVIFNNMQINHNTDKDYEKVSNTDSHSNNNVLNIEIIGVGKSSYEIDELYNKLQTNMAKDFYRECINSSSHLKIFNLSVLEILLFLENFGNVPSVVSEENKRFANYHQVNNSYEILRKQSLIEHSIMVSTLLFSQNTNLRESHHMEICILVGLCHDLGKIYGFKNVSSYKMHQHPKSSITIMNTELVYIKKYKYFELVESIVINHHRDNSYLSKTATDFTHELLDLFQTFDGKARRLYLEKYIEEENRLREKLIEMDVANLDSDESLESGCFEYGSATKTFDDILEDTEKKDNKENKNDKFYRRKKQREEIKNRLIEKTVANIENQLIESDIYTDNNNDDNDDNNNNNVDNTDNIDINNDINIKNETCHIIENENDNENENKNKDNELINIDSRKDLDSEVEEDILSSEDNDNDYNDDANDDYDYKSNYTGNKYEYYDRESYDPDAAFLENELIKSGFDYSEMDELELLHLENMKKQESIDTLDIPDGELFKILYPDIPYDERYDYFNNENDKREEEIIEVEYMSDTETQITQELVFNNESDIIKEISKEYELQDKNLSQNTKKQKKIVNKNSETISDKECNLICGVINKNKEYTNENDGNDNFQNNFLYKEFGLKENHNVDLSVIINEKDFIYYFEKKINVVKNGKVVAFTCNDDLVLLSLDSLIFFVETTAKNKGVTSLNTIKNPEHRFKVMLSSVVHLLRKFEFVDNRYIGPNFTSAPFSIRDYSDTTIVEKKFYVPIKISAFERIGDFEYFDKRKKGDLARYALCKNNFQKYN